MSYRSRSARRYKRPSRRYVKRWSSGRRPLPRTMQAKKLRAVANLRTGGMLGNELKFLDCGRDLQLLGTNFDSLPAATLTKAGLVDTANVYWLNCPGVGSGATERDGRVIRNVSIDVQGMVYIDLKDWGLAGIARPFNICIALVLDTQSNGTQPDGTEVYKNAVKYGLDPTRLDSLPVRVLENGPRFRVLRFTRKTFNDPGRNYMGTLDEVNYHACQKFSFQKKLGFKTHFTTDSVNPAVDAVVDNGIFLMAWTDYQINDAGPPLVWSPLMLFRSRFRFRG